MIYIIIWAILSTGNVRYVNPTYEHIIVYDEKDLASTIQEIKHRGYEVDITIYKAEKIKYNFWETPKKVEKEEQEPHLEIKETLR